MRWQHSPLVARMQDVVRYSREHDKKGALVGQNKATNLIVGAARELRELIEEIDRGERDGLGYPQTR